MHPGGSLGRKLWLRTNELMHRGDALPLVTPQTSFTNVLLEMTRKRLGLAIVVENQTVLGIVTDGDVRRHVQDRQGDCASSKADQIMTVCPKRIGESALAVEARELMEKNSIQHLLVYSEPTATNTAELVGVVHLQDLLRAKVV